MASPFRTFRKNQKAWMVGLTIMTMFAFVFLSNVAGNRSSQGEYKDPEVFTWKYGTVRKSDIDNRLYQRRFLNQFLAKAAYRAGQPDQVVAALQQNRLFPLVENEVAMAMLRDKKAQQMGIVVSDKIVNEFIRGIAPADKVSSQDLAAAMRELSSDRAGISQAQLFDTIRHELAAKYVDQT